MAPKRKKGPHLPYRQVGVGAEHGVGENGHRSTCYDLRVEDTLRARVRLARWRRVRALRLLRARARLSRLRLARVRAERKIREAVARIDPRASAIELIARAEHLRDKAEALWLIDEAIHAAEPIECPEWADS